PIAVKLAMDGAPDLSWLGVRKTTATADPCGMTTKKNRQRQNESWLGEVLHPTHRKVLSSLMTSVTDCPGTCVTFLLWLEDLLPSAARSCSAGQQDRFRASGWSRRRP